MAAESNVSGQRVLSGLKPLMLLLGVAAAVAAGVGVMLWSVGPTYSLLYANLSGEDASQVTQAPHGILPPEQFIIVPLRLVNEPFTRPVGVTCTVVVPLRAMGS